MIIHRKKPLLSNMIRRKLYILSNNISVICNCFLLIRFLLLADFCTVMFALFTIFKKYTKIK
ncbi:hypothetical protein T09_6234 [Trichinella sp. T9]|uniref:Uncharacterized protein n=1 Tax=Trichinella murrelli TaxID=144512 RepID=A0A0V0UGR3_9BILA|nr:hypothetical protein T05_2839 [Trichinella murrelli]KRX63964.1 hypothetical protein T09_6234 [Trichinella sp. T9]